MNKYFKIISRVLVLLLVASMLLVPVPVSAKENTTSIQDGMTLHCWNWSFKNIESKLDIIASLGYTAIQTSPIQLAKQPTLDFPTNDWWVFYQPADFVIDDTGNSALGTKADFESLCKAAHERGIKVIVDVVANHMGNTEMGGNGIAVAVNDELENDPDCWHDVKKNITDYNNRQQVTQYCMTALPDLNTSNKKVQNFVLNFLKECIDAGADGFRFDAIKHIETPEDGEFASDFWPTVVNGAKDYAKSTRKLDLYCYGELLDSVGGGLTPEAYTKYMSVTDNGWSYSLLKNVVVGGNANVYSSSFHKGEAKDLVLWAESHDTYADGTTMGVSEENINKAWALVAARSDAMGLYLARPANFSQLLGAASNTGWAYPEVAAVNQFHNAFVGKSEYVAKESGIAYIERGDSGVVLVNCKGTSGDISVTANAMADGTYTDQITGNTFTVANGKISGSIGDTGIAVVYETTACDHAEHDVEGFCTACSANVGHTYDESNACACGAVKTAERTVYFINSGKWKNVNFYSWYDAVDIFTNAWPGNAMTKISDKVYSCTVPVDIPNIIFNDNNGTQTDDLVLPAESEGLDAFDFLTKEWIAYNEEDYVEVTEPVETEPATEATEPQQVTEPIQPDDCKAPGSNAGLWIALGAVAVMAVAVAAVMIIKKKQ